MSDVLEEIGKMLESRKGADPSTSYVSSLYQDGMNRILEKIGEESAELLIAAKDAEQTEETEKVIHEATDLWFHTMVLLAHLNESPDSILKELESRLGTSGLVEKASRPQK